MALPRRLLQEGEEVTLEVRPHWRFLLRPTAALVAALGALVAAAALGAHDALQVALGVATLVALAWFVGRYLRWATTVFAVTTDRLIHRSGVLAKRGMEIPLERVNTVFFDQSLLERLLRAGDLVIESGGVQGRQHFADIGRPADVQAEIYRQIEANHARMVGAHRSGPASIPEQLEQLDALRRRGVVTEAEFAAKKAILLGRL